MSDTYAKIPPKKTRGARGHLAQGAGLLRIPGARRTCRGSLSLEASTPGEVAGEVAGAGAVSDPAETIPPRRRSRRSLVGRLITVLGLAFCVVELVLLGVFTVFFWGTLETQREAHLVRWAASVAEPVRVALRERGTDDSQVDAQLDAALAGQRSARGQRPAARFTPPAGAEVTVWVFTAEGPRRFTREGHLLALEDSAWQGPEPVAVSRFKAGDPIAYQVRSDRGKIVLTERVAEGVVIYLETSLFDLERQVANTALVAFATGALALLITALVTLAYLRRTLLVPLGKIVRADNAARKRDPEGGLVDEADIPDDEVGEIMRSRNHLYRSMLAAQAERDRQNESLETQREELRQWGRELELLVQDKSRALLRARDSLFRNEKLAAVGRLAANVAHEINNPLASIAGYAEEVRDELGGDHELSPSLRTIEEEAFRCKDILKRLLGLARAEASQRAPVDFGAVVRHSVALASPGAKRREVTLSLEGAPDEGPVFVSDEGALQQVVLNLVENAVDAAEQGEQPAQVTVSLIERPEALGLRVADSGRGIAPEVRARVFDPFYTTKPVGRGTGLGLAICQSLVERLGGTIQLADSTPDARGAVFEVWLPRGEGAQSKVDVGSAAVEAQLGLPGADQDLV